MVVVAPAYEGCVSGSGCGMIQMVTVGRLVISIYNTITTDTDNSETIKVMTYELELPALVGISRDKM